MLSLVRSRSEALESESAAKLKVQEQVASLTKKLDILNKDGDANLREQLQDYKVIKVYDLIISFSSSVALAIIVSSHTSC